MTVLTLLMGFVQAVWFPGLMVLAGAGDVLNMRIPNRLVAVIVASFFPLALWAGLPLATIGIHAATGACALLAGFLLFSGRIIGGGDAKLFAAAALWFGFPNMLSFLVYTTLAGGVLALVVAAWSAIRWEIDVRGLDDQGVFERLSPNVPYAYALAAGALLASPSAWWMAAAGN